ncbi:hypothetical protein AGMMS4952_00120 [Spirochaetia bacterium]|nr:hypothetical protein AGMMS4952_00120 [Spirochaetia bacterium]
MKTDPVLPVKEFDGVQQGGKLGLRFREGMSGDGRKNPTNYTYNRSIKCKNM